MDPQLLIPILLAAGGAAVIFAMRRRPSEPPLPPSPAPSVTSVSTPDVSELQGDLLQLQFDAQIAGVAAVQPELNWVLDRLFEVAARINGGGSVVEALRETIAHRLRPAALADDAAGVEAAKAPLEEVIALLSLSRDANDEATTRTVKAARHRIQSLGAAQPGERPLEELKAGDALRIDGRPYLVTDRHRYAEEYQGRTWSWRELVLIDGRTGARASLDLEKDDEWEAWLEVERPTLDALGIEPRALQRFDDEEAGSVALGGVRFRYADSGEALFYAQGGPDSERFAYWEFEAPSGRDLIAVEKWDEARYEVFRMRKVDVLGIEPLPQGVSRS